MSTPCTSGAASAAPRLAARRRASCAPAPQPTSSTAGGLRGHRIDEQILERLVDPVEQFLVSTQARPAGRSTCAPVRRWSGGCRPCSLRRVPRRRARPGGARRLSFPAPAAPRRRSRGPCRRRASSRGTARRADSRALDRRASRRAARAGSGCARRPRNPTCARARRS